MRVFLSKVNNFLAVFVSERMPAEKRCEFCGDNVSQNNYRRHLRRWHPEADGVFQLRTPSCDSTPSSETRHLIFETTFRSLSADYIRDATLCMLRRQEGNNVPTMSQYLPHYFPDIPEQYHMPLIVATFSAAQKVAATHGDTLLPGDDERICWARRSLARWTHGLSGVEKRCSSSSSGNEFLDRVSGRSTPTTLSAPIKNLEAPSNVHNVVLLSATPSRATSQSDEGDGNHFDRSSAASTDAKPTPVPYRSGGDDNYSEGLETASTNARPSPVPYRSGGDGDRSKKLDALSSVLDTAPAKSSTSQKPFDEPNGGQSDEPIVSKPNDVLTVESGASLTEKVVVIEHSDVEPDTDGECSTHHSNVFDSHKLPVPLESTFAQADVKAVLDEAVSSSSTTSSLFDEGPNEVIVRYADPDIDLLLCHESSVPPSMPRSFDEMLLDDDDEVMRSDLLRPLSIVLTPLTTPNADRFNTEEVDTPTDIVLHPSPHPSIEGDSTTSSVSGPAPVPEIRTEIQQGRMKGARIKRKVEEDTTVEKENVLSVAAKSTKSSSQLNVPAHDTSSEKKSTMDNSKSVECSPRDDHQRLKSTVSEQFRIPFKPKERNMSGPSVVPNLHPESCRRLYEAKRTGVRIHSGEIGTLTNTGSLPSVNVLITVAVGSHIDLTTDRLKIVIILDLVTVQPMTTARI